jgi:uncharacterized protein
MKLTSEAALPVEPDQLFALLTDVEKVAPCLPGTRLEGSDGDRHHGSAQIRVGSITAAYKGTVRLIEIDNDARRVVLSARGVDQHGSGNAGAKVDAQVRPHEGGSMLALQTDLLVGGKVAQFGRGTLGEVAQKMMDQFASNVSGLLTTPAQAASASSEPRSGTAPIAERPVATTAPMPAEAAEPVAVNGLAPAARPLLKRVAPIAGALAAGLAAAWLLRRAPWPRLGGTVPATMRLGDHTRTIPVRRTLRLR